MEGGEGNTSEKFCKVHLKGEEKEEEERRKTAS